jgi:hypothetical protein
MTPEERKKILERPTIGQMKRDSRPASANAGGFSGDSAAGWVGQGARQLLEPVVPVAKFAAGNVADAATLPSRALNRVGNNMYRGFTGQPIDNSKFVLNPVTQSLVGEKKPVGAQPGGRLALAANPAEMAREKLRGQSRLSQPPAQPIAQPQNSAPQINNTNPLRDTSPSSSRKRPQPNFLYPEDTERMSRLGGVKEMLRSPNPDINYSMLRDEKTGRLVVRETINGSGNNSPPALERPFVSAKQFRQIVGWDKDQNPIYSTGADEMAAANAGIADLNTARLTGYDQRNTAWVSENGTVPLQNAQTGLANAQTRTEAGMLGIKQQLGQASLGAANQQQQIATMMFNAQKTLADANSSAEQISNAKRVLDAFGEKAKPQVVTNKEAGPEGESQYSYVVNPDDPQNSALISSPEIAGRKKAQALIEVGETGDVKNFTKIWDSYSEAEQRAAIPLLPAYLLKMLLDRE